MTVLGPQSLSRTGLTVASGGGHLTALIRAAVLISSVLLMLPGAWGHSATVVEFGELPAGLAAWQRHSFAIYRVCGPSSKLLYALPAYLSGVRVDYPRSFDNEANSRLEWEVGRLFQSHYGVQYQNIYFLSRLLPIFITVSGGWVIAAWSTRLFGTWPGTISLCLWCWMPPVLAHGSLVTSDMLTAVAIILSALGFWYFLRAPRMSTSLVAGAALGFALATKFTMLILVPCWGTLMVVRAAWLPIYGESGLWTKLGPVLKLVALGVLMALTSLVVLDAFYFFQDVGVPLSQLDTGRSSLRDGLSILGSSPKTRWLLQVPLPIPLEYLRGLDVQLADTERPQSAYLLGRTRPGGWWYWYAAAFLLKVPVPALALFASALVRCPASPRDRDRTAWAAPCLLAPAAGLAVVVVLTTGTGTNAAFRYLLPSLSLLCVWIGRVWNCGSRLGRAVMVLLLAWLFVDAAVGLPDHLGWQNEIGGVWSRWRGQPTLIGDSLDWGQDLARLNRWTMSYAGQGGTLVCVYGLGDGDSYGLKPPAAKSASNRGGASFLAVSQEILYNDRVTNYIRIGGTFTPLSPDVRKMLLGIPPWAQVGRTIRIYRLRDLPGRLGSVASRTSREVSGPPASTSD